MAVETEDQARRIQKRRVFAGKRGYAKAVRRFMKKQTSDYMGLMAYREHNINRIPVNWEIPENKQND